MPRDTSSDDSDSLGLSRRKMLALTSGTALGLAGCQGKDSSGTTDTDSPTATETDFSVGTRSPTPTSDGSESTETDTPTDTAEPDAEPVEPELHQRVPVTWNPNDTNVAPLANNNGPWWLNYVWRQPTSYPNNRGQSQFFLIDSIDVNNCEVTYNLKDSYTWWNGDPVTAKDWHAEIQIDAYSQGDTPADTPSEWEVVDDYTLRQTLQSPQNPALIRYNSFGAVTAPQSWWKPWLDKYRDASSKKKRDAITKNLTQTEMTIQDLIDKGLGAGMWKPVEYDTTKIVHEKYEDHPRADWTNLTKYVWRLQASDQKARQGIKAGRYDVGHTLLPAAQDSNKVDVFHNFPVTGVQKIAFNFNNEHLARRAVRRAIAYAVDFKEVKQVLKSKNGKRTSIPDPQVGMSGAVAPRWLSDGFRNNVIDYGKRAKPKMAKKALEDANYSKQGDRWVGPNGKKIEFDYITPPWGTYKTTAKYISSKLSSFGLKTKLTIPSGSGFNKRWRDTYDFDMANWFYKGWHPSQTYGAGSGAGLGDFRALIKDQSQSGPSGCKVYAESPELTSNRTKRLNHPAHPKYPKKVGQKGTSGPMQTLKPIKWVDLLNQISSKDRTRKLAEKLGWYFNWQLPHMGVYESTWSFWGDTKNFNMLDAHQHPQEKQTRGEHTINLEHIWTRGHIASKTK